MGAQHTCTHQEASLSDGRVEDFRDNPRMLARYREQIDRTLRDTASARAAAVAAATHTCALEAGAASPQLADDLQRYLDGSLDSGQLVERTLARYGAGR
jgi:Antitoxin VbhA